MAVLNELDCFSNKNTREVRKMGNSKGKPAPYRRIIVTQVGAESYEVKKLINFMDLKRGQVVSKQDLDWVKSEFESPYGTIQSNWQVSGGKLTLKVAVPPNTTATVYLPTANTESVKESKQPVSKARGVKLLGEEKGCSVLEVQPGGYTFEAQL